MADDAVEVQAHYEEWLRLSYLSMEPHLAGAEHPFVFEDRNLTVRLPDLPSDNKGPDQYATAFISIRRTATNEPVQVAVYAVLVMISDLAFTIPSIAASSPMNTSLYTDEQRRELDASSNELWRVARRALDYWLRVVRFVTGQALISLDTNPRDPMLSGGSLINSATNRRFYTPSIQRTIIAQASHRLAATEWKEIGIALKTGVSPPIWHEYFMRGRHRINIGDLRASVLDLATCSELAIRRYIESRLPAETPAGVRDILARANMSDIFRRWQTLGLPPKKSIAHFSMITTLFEVRNAIAHRGEDSHATECFCKQASSAVQDLLTHLKGVHGN